MGSTLDTWAPFDDWLYRDLALSLMHSKLAGGSIFAYLSAVGTFAEMLGYSRPNQAWISYIIKGLSTTMALPEKSQVVHFLYAKGLAQVDLECQAMGISLLYHMQIVLAMCLLMWPMHPHAMVLVL